MNPDPILVGLIGGLYVSQFFLYYKVGKLEQAIKNKI